MAVSHGTFVWYELHTTHLDAAVAMAIAANGVVIDSPASLAAEKKSLPLDSASATILSNDACVSGASMRMTASAFDRLISVSVII